MDGSFQERFYQIKRRQLGPELGVSQQVVDRLLQIEQHYQALRRQLFKNSKADFQHLVKVLSQPSPGEQEVKPILNKILRHPQEKQNIQQMQTQEEEKLLTPVQEARKILYQKRLLQEARNVKRSQRGPQRLGPPSGPREIQVSRKTVGDVGSGGAYQEKELTLNGQQPRMVSALGVNQQTVVQLLQIRERYRPRRQQLILEARNEFSRLEQVMRQPNPVNPEVKTILNNIKKKEQEMQDLKQRQEEEVVALLTPVQHARYLLFLISMRHQPGSGPRSLGPPGGGGVGAKPAGNSSPGWSIPSRPSNR
jgi:hypothetical protein